MNRSQAVAIANAVMAIRPDWQQPGIIAQLEQLQAAWPGTDAGLAAYVMSIAGNPAAQTPGAFNATPIPQTAQPSHTRWSREPRCHTCGNLRSRCHELRAIEEARGIPDPHDFESLDDAERRTAGRQLQTQPRKD